MSIQFHSIKDSWGKKKIHEVNIFISSLEVKKSPAIVPLANMKIYNDHKTYPLWIKMPTVHRLELLSKTNVSNYNSRLHNNKMNDMNKILMFQQKG